MWFQTTEELSAQDSCSAAGMISKNTLHTAYIGDSVLLKQCVCELIKHACCLCKDALRMDAIVHDSMQAKQGRNPALGYLIRGFN